MIKNQMLPVETTEAWHLFFNDKSYVEFSDGSPRIEKSEILPLSQGIYDLLSGHGLTYMQCVTIILMAQEALKEKRNKAIV